MAVKSLRQLLVQRADLPAGKMRPEQRGTQAETPTGRTPRPHPMEARVHWLHPKRTPLWLAGLVILLILAVPILLGGILPTSEDPGHICTRYALEVTTLGITGTMLLIMVPLTWKLRTMLSTRIGFRDEWVLVDHGNGNVRIARDEDLIAVKNGFLIDGVAVPTGPPQMPLYDRKALKQWLRPRLDRGTRLGPIRQLSWQWQHRRGVFIFSTMAIAVGLALVVALETGWLEARFHAWLQQQPACEGVMPVARSSRTTQQHAIPCVADAGECPSGLWYTSRTG